MTDQDVTEGREQCENILATVHIARQQIYELVAANRLTRIDAAKLLVDSYAVEGEAQGALLLYGGAA
jgi:hypothetical protein